MTPKQEEALVILAEECAEVIQIVSKILRFGTKSFHPDDPTQKTNIAHLTSEIGDVLQMVDIVKAKFGITTANLDTAKVRKYASLVQHSHLYKNNCGND